MVIRFGFYGFFLGGVVLCWVPALAFFSKRLAGMIEEREREREAGIIKKERGGDD